MYQYYIIEIKKTNGEYEHNVFWEFDADQDKARRKAEAKAHQLLAVAALSETSIHSVTVLSDQGFAIMNKCYQNVKEEPTPEE